MIIHLLHYYPFKLPNHTTHYPNHNIQSKPHQNHSTLLKMIQTDTTIKMVVSPINKTKKSNGNRDYREQCLRETHGQQLMWDDCKGNPTKKPGGLFGFVHNGNRVEIHMVTQICPVTDRLDSWSDNVGQTDRNVLLLTPRLAVIQWSEWIELGAPHKIQGTSRIVTAHNNIWIYVLLILGRIEYIQETGEIFFINY